MWLKILGIAALTTLCESQFVIQIGKPGFRVEIGGKDVISIGNDKPKKHNKKNHKKNNHKKQNRNHNKKKHEKDQKKQHKKSEHQEEQKKNTEEEINIQFPKVEPTTAENSIENKEQVLISSQENQNQKNLNEIKEQVELRVEQFQNQQEKINVQEEQVQKFAEMGQTEEHQIIEIQNQIIYEEEEFEQELEQEFQEESEIEDEEEDDDEEENDKTQMNKYSEDDYKLLQLLENMPETEKKHLRMTGYKKNPL